MTQNDLRKKYPYYDQIQRLRLIDDTFMSVVFQDIGCTQFLIRILLQNDGLNVTEVGTQKFTQESARPVGALGYYRIR